MAGWGQDRYGKFHSFFFDSLPNYTLCLMRIYIYMIFELYTCIPYTIVVNLLKIAEFEESLQLIVYEVYEVKCTKCTKCSKCLKCTKCVKCMKFMRR